MHNEFKKVSVTPQANTVPYSNESGNISSWLENDPVINSLKGQNEFIGTITTIPSGEDLQDVLSQFVYTEKGRQPRSGDEVNIEDVGELWMYNGTTWIYFTSTVHSLQNTATGTNAVTILGTPATTAQSHNIGISSTASTYGTSVGYSAASTTAGTAIGTQASASNYAVAVGSADSSTYATTASGANSVAVGYNAKATAANAIQLGYGTNATASTLSVGLDSSNNYQLLNASGKVPNARLNIDGSTIIDDNGVLKAATSGAIQNTATGYQSLTILGTPTTIANTVNIGYNTVAYGPSVSVGESITLSSETGSGTCVAIGENIRGGKGSVLIGTSVFGYDENSQSVSRAVAIGESTSVSATAGVAIGSASHANGAQSVAVGYNATASGESAIQLGAGTNSTNQSLSVGFTDQNLNISNYQLLDGTTGLIPSDRLPTASANVKGAIKLSFDTSTGTLNIITE